MKNGYKSVAYSKLVAPLIEAVKEQQKSISELKKNFAELERQNVLLKKYFCKEQFIGDICT